MFTTEYTASGMTCGNCERHIREEVEQIADVIDVQVNRGTGRLSVTTAGAPVSDEAVLAAVDEAGYLAVRAA